MDRNVTREMRRQLERDNAKRPLRLVEVPREEWPKTSFMTALPLAIWRSRFYLVQIYREVGGVTRLSINKTTMLPNGRWDDGLVWDELQDIKRQVGFGDRQAVEIYPEDPNIVNAANMRHLWILPERIDIGWVRHE